MNFEPKHEQPVENGDIRAASGEKQRRIPHDIYEASVISQRGELVDITYLIPASEKSLFQKDVQQVFDWVAKTVNSSEYTQFEIEIGNLLAEVKDQNFIFDIEGTVMNDVQNSENISERVYHVVPWMRPFVVNLIKNGNHVGFWTSATRENLENMRKAMSPEMANLPAICREDWEKVVVAYKARSLNQMTDEQVIEAMQSVYPTVNPETFQTGLELFDKDLFESFNHDPTNFLRYNKYPQLFISPKNGFFIDDNNVYINSATERGWPKNRAIKCDYFPQRENVLEVAQAIKEGATK